MALPGHSLQRSIVVYCYVRTFQFLPDGEGFLGKALPWSWSHPLQTSVRFCLTSALLGQHSQLSSSWALSLNGVTPISTFPWRGPGQPGNAQPHPPAFLEMLVGLPCAVCVGSQQNSSYFEIKCSLRSYMELCSYSPKGFRPSGPSRKEHLAMENEI